MRSSIRRWIRRWILSLPQLTRTRPQLLGATCARVWRVAYRISGIRAVKSITATRLAGARTRLAADAAMRESIIDWILIVIVGILFGCLFAGFPFYDLIK
jgi:hypothetical protein